MIEKIDYTDVAILNLASVLITLAQRQPVTTEQMNNLVMSIDPIDARVNAKIASLELDANYRDQVRVPGGNKP